MKKPIKKIGTVTTVGIMLAGAFWMGKANADQELSVQAGTEPIETMQKENTCPQQRIMCGNYYDYMVIETVDGNEWLLDDSSDSPYIENDIALFGNGELVQVVFDTKGTEAVEDDEIVEVRSIDWRYK